MDNCDGTITVTQRRAAGIAAWTLLGSIALIIYANFGLRGEMLVPGDMAETVQRVRQGLPRFRLSLGIDVAYCVAAVVVVAGWYQLLTRVNRYLAFVAVTLKLLYVASAMLTVLSYFHVVRLVSGATGAAIAPELTQGLVRVELLAMSDQYYSGVTFWALSSAVFYWLWFRSQMVPAGLALVGAIASLWCAASCAAYLLVPSFGRVVNVWVYDAPMVLTDIALCVWLLARGFRGTAPVAGPPAVDAASADPA